MAQFFLAAYFFSGIESRAHDVLISVDGRKPNFFTSHTA